MVWLVLAACAMCLIVGLGLGIGLAHAAARGDDRTGMVDLTGITMDPHVNAATTPVLRYDPLAGRGPSGAVPAPGTRVVAVDAEDRSVRGRTIDVEITGQGPGDQSAA